MDTKINIVVAGHSSFTWALVAQLRQRIEGRLYFVLPDHDQAMEAGLQDNVIAICGDMTDTQVLDQLDLQHCHTFIAGSREEEANVLSALYAKNCGAQFAYARVFNTKFMPLLDVVGVIPLQTSHTAAAFMTVSILEPAVAELVSPTQGQFDLVEIDAATYPEFIGCRLGNLQGEELHVIAVAQEGEIFLGYNTVIAPAAKLIIIYNKQIRKNFPHALRKVATQAVQRIQSTS